MFNSISTQANKLLHLTKKNSTASKTKIITITSGKGGVGKSTFTANMAYLLARRGYKIAIVDADIGLANMQVLFDIKPRLTLFDYIEGRNTINEIISSTAYNNLDLVAGKSGYQYANLKNSLVLSRVVDEIKGLNKYDIVLIDTGAGLNEYVQEFLSVSNNILALTTTDPSALTDVYALMKMLSIDKDRLLICFNHTKNYKIGETIANSLVNLAKKNRLNHNFVVKYIGNVSTSANITTTSRLRKLFAHEFINDEITKQLHLVIDSLLENIH
ncbi:ATP-binding protein [Halarcobacter ebronensis]|uniref:ATP-binding protein n=1 Tax=Halarcobacter ebronensis TaxID=1462615 RepID=A0A4Q1AT20_9BACT|nr:AAA family ATPase [Halarcobacter ebronensis]QKF82896.1 polar flagellar biogenesis regulatory protein FlhG [Halarcobacter ebronensis]RXJ69594.1 ATP-binding protein [Halarcobacter ebronensis]RXK06913.1 ATP-binding protein [Halarcobacter ebronensis]